MKYIVVNRYLHLIDGIIKINKCILAILRLCRETTSDTDVYHHAAQYKHPYSTNAIHMSNYIGQSALIH